MLAQIPHLFARGFARKFTPLHRLHVVCLVRRTTPVCRPRSDQNMPDCFKRSVNHVSEFADLRTTLFADYRHQIKATALKLISEIASCSQWPIVSESTRFSAPVSSAEMVAISAVVSAKSKMSRFWASRSGFDDLGIVAMPISMFQRRTT